MRPARKGTNANFNDVLDGLAQSASEGPFTVGHATPPLDFSDRHILHSSSEVRSAPLESKLYAEDQPWELSAVVPQKSEQQLIADELGLNPSLTARTLRRMRRRFALTNHPDRVPAAEREQATRRMVIANGLIDQALQLKSNRSGFATKK
jgi:hypothetical protein